MRLISLLLCFSLCLSTTACENEGDFLPPEGSTNPDGGGVTGGEITGKWALVGATTSLQSTSTASGQETTSTQAGVLTEPTDYVWTITANPNRISSSGRLTLAVTTTIDSVTATVEIPVDPTLNAINSYERMGGTLVVDSPGGQKIDATILELNDSIFNLHVEYVISASGGGASATNSNKNTYFFRRQ